MADSQSNWDAQHCQFPKSDQEILLTNQVATIFCLQNEFISLLTLHESCRPIRLDEFRFLNLLISISEAQYISM